MDQLLLLRRSGAALGILQVRALFLALIRQQEPHLLESRASNGTTFKCSNAFVKSILRQLKWSVRQATKAAGKLPNNWTELCRKAHLHMAYVLREFDVPAQLIVNSDETSKQLQNNPARTWNLLSLHRRAFVSTSMSSKPLRRRRRIKVGDVRT